MKIISFLIVTITLSLVLFSAYTILSASISSKTSNYHLVKEYISSHNIKSKIKGSAEYVCRSDISTYSVTPKIFAINQQAHSMINDFLPAMYGACKTQFSVVVLDNII